VGYIHRMANRNKEIKGIKANRNKGIKRTLTFTLAFAPLKDNVGGFFGGYELDAFVVE
jgi:hypothetical protein